MLETLYTPLQRELAEVEQLIKHLTQSDFPLLDQVSRHLFGRKGKQLRPLLFLHTYKLFKQDVSEEALRCAAMIEILHISSLVHDDVVDEADRRRGQASVRALVGNRTAVLSGDYLISNALVRTFHNSTNPALLLSMLDTIRTMCEGELLQWQHTADPNLDEATYEKILAGKTAALFGQCGYCGALTAGATDQEAAIARLVGQAAGMAFQIKDDLLDIDPKTETQEGKTPGNDLREGKLTLPTLFYVRGLSEADRQSFFTWLQDPSARQESMEPHLDRIRACGAAAYCHTRMASYAQAAKAAFATLNRPSTAYLALIDEICGSAAQQAVGANVATQPTGGANAAGTNDRTDQAGHAPQTNGRPTNRKP